MKSLLLAVVVLVLFSALALADTYTGVVSEVKQFHSGGTAVDMDGTYPNQKMVLYVAAGESKVTKMPAVGDKAVILLWTGQMPSTKENDDPERDRRLMFVGLTRDEDYLTVSYSSPTPFADELVKTDKGEIVKIN